MTAIHLAQVSKEYALGKTSVRALNDVNLTIHRGEFTVIAGPSGSGKTTLLNIIGCMDSPSSGTIKLYDKDISKMNDRERTNERLHTIGFIFQSFNLIPVLNMFDNIEFPLLLMKIFSRHERKERVDYFLHKVGLYSHKKHRPNELSGGQRQRVAIARALVTKPKMVLADEPTANLDSKTGGDIIELMRSINASENTTFLFSSHDHAIISHAQRIIRLHDGEVTTS